MNAIINIGTLIPFAISISDAINGAKSYSSTAVEIGAGIGANGQEGDFGGAVPAVSIWNEQGARLGQYMPGKKDKIASGTSNSKPIVVNQDQGATGQPEYALLTTVNDDAICITYVTVSGNGVSWNWMGDIGYTCGADWYPSTAKFGTDNYQPKCTWLDANHSDKLRFMAMSMHMPDFNGDVALTDEYNANNDNLCNSKARYMMWGQLPADPGYNSIPPMFNPPLQYNADGSDKDFDALFKPGRAHDKRDMHSTANSTTIDHKDGNDNMNGRIDRPGHVVISDYKAHSAAEVCGSETSRGPSFVSAHDGMYCDMSTKTTHTLCTDTVTTGCFDADAMQLIGDGNGNGRHHPRDLTARDIRKRYETHERWTPSQ